MRLVFGTPTELPRLNGGARQDAGLYFAPELAARMARKAAPGVRLYTTACVYAAAVLETIAATIINDAQRSITHTSVGCSSGLAIILPRQILQCVAFYDDLRPLLPTEVSAGVVATEPLVVGHEHVPADFPVFFSMQPRNDCCWTEEPTWLDEGLAWEFGDIALLAVRDACGACVVLTEELLRQTGGDRENLLSLRRDAHAVAHWISARPSFESPGIVSRKTEVQAHQHARVSSAFDFLKRGASSIGRSATAPIIVQPVRHIVEQPSDQRVATAMKEEIATISLHECSETVTYPPGDSQAAGAAAGLELPAALRVHPHIEARLVALLARIDALFEAVL